MRLIGVAFMVVEAVLSSSLDAKAIEGLYRVEGQSPGSEGEYAGLAQLKRTGGTYSIVWQIGGTRHIGTGLLTDNVLSVVVQPLGANMPPGIAAFRVVEGRVVDGTWAGIGTQAFGTERWTYMER